MKLMTASLVGLLVATPLAAQEPPTGAQPGQAAQGPQTEERPREHVVREGDTLWDLATFYFDNPWVWPSIYQANLAVVDDPHWIYPEEVLIIPGLYDSVQRRAPVPTSTVAVRPMDRPLRTVFYRAPVGQAQSGDEPTVLSEPTMARLPVKPGEFRSAEFLADPGDLGVVARMLRPVRSVDVASRDVRATAHPKDLVFLGYASRTRPEPGSRLLLVRQGRRVSTSDGRLRLMQPTALVSVVALHPEVIEARIVEQYAPVLLDQLAIPVDLFPDFQGEEAEPVEGDVLEGRLIEFITEQPLYGRGERGFIDLGARQGVQVGDVFMAFLPERRVRRRDPGELRRYIEELPPEAVAELRVLRVMDGHATVRVDQVVLPVLEDGIRVRRIRKMP